MTSREEDVEERIKEVIKCSTLKNCSISTDPNPRVATVEYAVIILYEKFLLILNFGRKTLHNGCRTNNLGESNKRGAIHLKEGHQKT